MITSTYQRFAAGAVAVCLLASAGCGSGSGPSDAGAASSSAASGGSGAVSYVAESTSCERTASGWSCFAKWAAAGQLIKLRFTEGVKKVERVVYTAPPGEGDLSSIAYRFNDAKESQFKQEIPVAVQVIPTPTQGVVASEIAVILTGFRNLRPGGQLRNQPYTSEAQLGSIEVFGS